MGRGGGRGGRAGVAPASYWCLNIPTHPHLNDDNGFPLLQKIRKNGRGRGGGGGLGLCRAGRRCRGGPGKRQFRAGCNSRTRTTIMVCHSYRRKERMDEGGTMRYSGFSTNLITMAVLSSPSCFLLQSLLPCCCATSFYPCTRTDTRRTLLQKSNLSILTHVLF
jgi:hypothetical protein